MKSKIMLSFSDWPHQNIAAIIKKNVYSQACFVNGYIIQDQIGRGKFGTVYLCKNQWGKSYAFKVYDIQTLRKQQGLLFINKFIESINFECELMNQCHSPYIVKFNQCFENKLSKAIVMQYCNYQNLRAYLTRKGQSLDQIEAVAIIKQICLGVIEMHRNNIIHRDLKLENIMVVNGVCKIIDLGFSKKLKSENDITFTNAGTDYTRAPEITSQKYYGLKADIYSIGIIYMILIGSCEYSKRTAYAFNNDRAYLFRNKKISEQSIDFIAKLIERNQDIRVNWRQLLNHKLFLKSKQLAQSQIEWIGQDFNELDINTNEIVLNCSALTQSSINQHSIMSLIMQSEQKQKQNVRFSINYSQQVCSAYLQYKKVEFILKEIIQILQTPELNLLDLQVDNHSIMMYLLSQRSFLNLNLASSYFQKQQLKEFIKQISITQQIVSQKYYFYFKRVDEILNSVKESGIFKLFRGKEQKRRQNILTSIEVNEEDKQKQINLTVQYIKKNIDGFYHRRIKRNLLAYPQIIRLKMTDLKDISFEEKVKFILGNQIF